MDLSFLLDKTTLIEYVKRFSALVEDLFYVCTSTDFMKLVNPEIFDALVPYIMEISKFPNEPEYRINLRLPPNLQLDNAILNKYIRIINLGTHTTLDSDMDRTLEGFILEWPIAEFLINRYELYKAKKPSYQIYVDGKSAILGKSCILPTYPEDSSL